MYNESLFSVSPSIQMSINWVALNYSEFFIEQHPSVSSNFTQSDFAQLIHQPAKWA